MKKMPQCFIFPWTFPFLKRFFRKIVNKNGCQIASVSEAHDCTGSYSETGGCIGELTVLEVDE